ncbi:uncharacterized protein FSUBG_5134 [Fusarium subglutinans]|uniref:Transcription factor domain-containing protein n=1 Tax=Gibberella subglutinans TaxID=42677 RepID=A0A8H5Q514_GIBSU|nr:uncharacterized protein FSUBG_5134 [Fusarium subglutinans]KAF5607596.1 hypothetical protein FSUBG_5134 [Fusarium subglutinans]
MSSRPNGRPEACDPCRARKVACDHRRPISSRVKASIQSSPSLSPQPAKPMARDYAFSPGYLGFTSYNSVFQGARESLSLSDTGSGIPSPEVSNPGSDDVCLRSLPLPTQQMCLVVLRYLPGRPEAHMIFHDEPGPENTTTWSHTAVSRIIKSLRQLFQSFEGSECFDEQVADVLCRNTSKPVNDTFDGFDDWIAQFCGPNIRWESIGLLWAHLEGLSDAISTLKYRQLQWVGGKRSSVLSHDHIHYCIEIARRFTAGNNMLLDLCRRHAALGTMVYGDASPVYWNSHSLCVSILLFTGLHASGEASRPEKQPQKPSFCVEHKRLLYSYIFANDKSEVSFTGRPPLLSRRYCSSVPPLDLPDSCMVSEDTLIEEFKALDERGWNVKGEISSNSYIRARYLMAYVFDEVIEVALGNNTHVTLEYLDFDLVMVTVKLWIHKNRFAPMRRNFEWLLVAYGALGGGILCQELLRPTFFGVHPLNPALSRSNIVQQLSLLVAFLNWVGPSSPNRVVCGDCEAIIQRVLDEHLNSEPTGNTDLVPLGIGVPPSLTFGFELLNTFEWLQNGI